MPDGSIPLLIVLIILILFSAFFSATETAYSCVNKIRLRAKGDKKSKHVLLLAEDNFDKLITTVLIGNNIVNLTAATIATIFFANIINGTTVDSSVISTATITVAVLLFGEIVPKFIAKTYPEKLAIFNYPVIIFFYYLFYPLNYVFSACKWFIAKIFKLKDTSVVTEEEILTIVEEAEEDGTLKKEETKLIRSVIEFDDLEVGDILVPRVNIVSINIDASMDEIKKTFEKEGYSRIPVFKNDIDTIVGTIHEKDFFNAYLSGKKNIDSILQNAYYTTEHIKISKLLKMLQKNKTHIAIVLDEYGGTLGLVTMEDILEELVGEIWDEHDEEINYFKKTGESCFVDGNAPINEFFEHFGFDDNNEESEVSTVSGWIIEKLGEIPLANKKFEYQNFTIEITKSTVRRILQIKVTKNNDSLIKN